MATQDTWTIEGYRGRQVPNRFFQVGDGERENDQLAVILPGIRYTNDAPVLYYARKLLLEQQQSDVLAVDYGYGFDRRFQEAPADAPTRNRLRRRVRLWQGRPTKRDAGAGVGRIRSTTSLGGKTVYLL